MTGDRAMSDRELNAWQSMQEWRRYAIQLRAALEGFAQRGTRHDTMPTVRPFADVGECVSWFYGYVQQMDKQVRDIARDALNEQSGAVIAGDCPECGVVVTGEGKHGFAAAWRAHSVDVHDLYPASVDAQIDEMLADPALYFAKARGASS